MYQMTTPAEAKKIAARLGASNFATEEEFPSFDEIVRSTTEGSYDTNVPDYKKAVPKVVGRPRKSPRPATKSQPRRPLEPNEKHGIMQNALDLYAFLRRLRDEGARFEVIHANGDRRRFFLRNESFSSTRIFDGN